MTNVDESTVEHNREDGLEVDTQGFSFHTLKSVVFASDGVYFNVFYRLLHADLGPQLEEFKLHLEHNSREIPQLKAWQLQGRYEDYFMYVPCKSVFVV